MCIRDSLGDYEFSMTISADQLPNYYEMANVAYGPEPLAAIAPGCDVKDDGNGAYLTDGFTEDLIRATLLDPDKGFRYKAPVSYTHLDVYKRQTSRFMITVREVTWKYNCGQRRWMI